MNAQALKAKSVSGVSLTCGFPERSMTRGYLERTKRLIDVAYEVWRLKNKIPKHDHWRMGFGL